MKFYGRVKDDLVKIFGSISQNNFDLALKEADLLEQFINGNTAFKDEAYSITKVNHARATAFVNRAKMNQFIGKRAESLQDLEIAKKLALKTVKDFEKQYGSTGEYTLATGRLLLNIYQLTGEREASIE